MKVERVNYAVIRLAAEEKDNELDYMNIKNLMEAFFKVFSKYPKDEVLTATQVRRGIFDSFGLWINEDDIQRVIDSM